MKKLFSATDALRKPSLHKGHPAKGHQYTGRRKKDDKAVQGTCRQTHSGGEDETRYIAERLQIFSEFYSNGDAEIRNIEYHIRLETFGLRLDH